METVEVIGPGGPRVIRADELPGYLERGFVELESTSRGMTKGFPTPPPVETPPQEAVE